MIQLGFLDFSTRLQRIDKAGDPLEKINRVAGGFSPPAPTTPCVRLRTGRFIKITGP